MEEISYQKILTKIGLAILVVALVDLVYLNWWVLKSDKLNPPAGGEGGKSEAARSVDLIPPSPEATSLPSPSNSPQTETTVEKKTQTIIQTAQKEIFIPIGSGISNNGTYSEIGGLEVTFDTSKYPTIESLIFEASLSVVGGNGRAYARLYNATDQYVLLESQISNSSEAGVLKSSDRLPILLGAKTFKVQAKTDITNFAARVENARIKITLK